MTPNPVHHNSIYLSDITLMGSTNFLQTSNASKHTKNDLEKKRKRKIEAQASRKSTFPLT